MVASGDQVSRSVGEETVILGLKGDMYFGLNPVGSRVWSLIQEPRTVAQVRDAILEEYQVEPAECERDVVAMLARLADQKLIEVRE